MSECTTHFIANLLDCQHLSNLQQVLANRLMTNNSIEMLMASVALNDPDRPPCIDAALAAVQAVAPAPYTRVGLNLYRGAQDSVAMHNDRTHDLAPGQPIAILSLGAPRDMLIRAKQGGASQRVRLDPGSVLVMSHASQHTHEHGIPKTADGGGPRISLAFRVRLPTM